MQTSLTRLITVLVAVSIALLSALPGPSAELAPATSPRPALNAPRRAMLISPHREYRSTSGLGVLTALPEAVPALPHPAASALRSHWRPVASPKSGRVPVTSSRAPPAHSPFHA